MEKLARLTASVGEPGVSYSTVQTIEQRDPATRREDRTILLLGDALAEIRPLAPGELQLYDLARARRLLDDRNPPLGVGLTRALANLEKVRVPLALDAISGRDADAGPEVDHLAATAPRPARAGRRKSA